MKFTKILAAASLAALTAACSGGADKEECVKTFVGNFAANTANADSVKAMYPGWCGDSIAFAYSADSVKIAPAETEGVYTVTCGPAEMTIEQTPEGGITIKSSKGLATYPADRLAAAKKFGQWKDGLTDAELSQRMNDTTFTAGIMPEFVKNFKGNLKAVGTGGCSFNGRLGVKVTNNNDKTIDAGDYSVSYVQRSYMRMMGEMACGDVRGSRPGQELKPNGSFSFSVQNPGAMAGNEVHSATIKWKLTDQQIFDKYYQPTGKEYDTYLASKK